MYTAIALGRSTYTLIILDRIEVVYTHSDSIGRAVYVHSVSIEVVYTYSDSIGTVYVHIDSIEVVYTQR